MSMIHDSEFQKEEEHLAYTKGYMEILLQEAEQNQEKLKEELQQSLAELKDLDSSLSYTSLLSNTKFLEMATKELDALKRVKSKPYFARIDFKKNDQNQEDVYYFGKTSLYERDSQEPIIVDWRSPVASLYYDGRLGNVSYSSYEEEVEGYLSLKRQFRIDNGKLVDYVDVDLTANDDLLLEALSGKADNRLTEIVTTIQAEQNRVIRADLNRPIIVQGAAGSGKTTIALHRISYFIYHYKDKFQPEQMMIIAPNNMFIGYIAEVLPELGVDKIRQTTYIDYVKQCIGKKIKVVEPEQKLISLVNHDYEDEKMVRWSSHFKGTLTYKKIIDRYLRTIREELSPTDDFFLEKFKLTTGKRLERLFKSDYRYLPFYKRLEKIQNVLKTEIRQKKKQILYKLEKRYDEQLEQALFHISNSEKRKERVVYLMDTQEKRIEAIQKEAKSAVKSYMSRWTKETLLGYYKKLFFDVDRFSSFAADILSEAEIQFFVHYNQQLLIKNQVEVEDLGALFYMQHILFGIDKDLRAKNVVIDEAQDYSNFQLYALKVGLDTEMFTIVGDLAQGIHSYRGLENWHTLQTEIFPKANYVTLQKSYRTTIEIMNVANDILGRMPAELPKVEPVIRHGQLPTYYSFTDADDLVKKVKLALDRAEAAEYQSIALITKSESESKAMMQLLKRKLDYPVQLLKENEEIQKGKLVIVPSYLSKGLEFDAVLIATLNEAFTLDEIDIKLLYVSMTRPMHQLSFFAKHKNDLLLHYVADEHIEIAMV
ncbi:UvrD-helicase domain-containing protein [Caldibacillus lycopersici]|uniref:UvrD-helicase domain-containing protein n=1 Tax=Perspicuibacillus lycopersici TaxID=1325689 RepID=A0AAE3IQX8_9BACI|nr:RNA polymerase recycling motor HelD [Perspicuibacillus lycopersici]MCU9612796.1 UvrD-helicase domain-containing protein [Perspicuibacillus lycopersici]